MSLKDLEKLEESVVCGRRVSEAEDGWLTASHAAVKDIKRAANAAGFRPFKSDAKHLMATSDDGRELTLFFDEGGVLQQVLVTKNGKRRVDAALIRGLKANDTAKYVANLNKAKREVQNAFRS